MIKTQNIKNIEIIKADGTKQIFSEKKLMRSLLRSGASTEVAKNISTQVTNEIGPDTRTKDIYRHTFRLLKKGTTKPVAFRYNLRNAIAELGPDGFPFEKFVGEILKGLGYEVQVGVIIPGLCIEHEVDVSAIRNYDHVHDHILVECKFHNTPATKTDLKVALYVKERFEDIEKKYRIENPDGDYHYKWWLVTNTKLTTKAIQYSECVGLHAVGWGYPEEGNLEDLILETKIHPITALTTLSMQQKRQLLEKRIVLCRDLRNSNVLRKIGLNDKKINAVMNEIEVVKNVHK